MNPNERPVVDGVELALDYFVSKNILVYQHPAHFRFNTDTRLLAQFMRIKKGESVLEIGCNNGVLLVYADQFKPKRLIGVDRLAQPLQIAQINADRWIEAPVELILSPIQEVEHALVDVVISNPPFFEMKELHPNTKINHRTLGRFEFNGGLEDWIFHASRLLKSKGRFYLVHRPDRIQEILSLGMKHSLSLKRMQLAFDSRDHQAKALLVEFIKEGNTKAIVQESVWI